MYNLYLNILYTNIIVRIPNNNSNQKALNTNILASIVPKSFSINVATAIQIAKTNKKNMLEYIEKKYLKNFLIIPIINRNTKVFIFMLY